ncbi:vacuolar protein 14 C-terminal Fig4p binding-domain-containing protein [Zychaea mexicana]|uniref:vacuolar protein 14 C-terminal Fig4p binding-domain-containing protein n=1 Tax=Zychaea mexicana TaxID=64656 RepID=UPI0022FEC86C|nr:vacuolar protein 14 C-terminal Fig4p binding-domain-containing protein [Zychaea mexicana]KAI9489409.1 vacuolar protein 14 C-terminal Fig4p binding-domain-containing protein [Zychaea mexicana]
MSAMKSSVFSTNVIQELTDKTYDRRKVAALEVERLVKQNKGSQEQINGIIRELVEDFIYSDSSNAQCGGLISLAATAIALGPSVAAYLDTVVPPILACLNSKDSRVRYYACECILCLNSQRPMSHPIAVTAASAIIATAKKTAFQLSKFIPVLRRHLYTSNPFERMYVMSWIGILDSVPGLDLVWYLPDLLDGIIRYLTDTRHQIRANARLLLAQFFQEIQFISRQTEDEGVAMQKRDSVSSSSSASAGGESSSSSSFTTSDTINNSNELLTPPQTPQTKAATTTTTTSDDKHQQKRQQQQLQYDRILEILIQHISSTKEEIQRTALQWMIEFTAAAKPVVLQFTPRIVSAVLPLLSHSVPTISAFAMEINRNLQNLVMDNTNDGTAPSSISSVAKTTTGPILLRRAYRSDIGLPVGRPKNGEPFDYSMTVANLKVQFLSEHEQARFASLEWLLLLHKKAPNKVLASTDGILPELFKALLDPSEDVVHRDLELLAQIAAHSNDDAFLAFVKRLLSLFEIKRQLLESRGSFIIRQLCVNLDVEKMYRTMADILEHDKDLEFASMMVQNLNIIMITSSEMNCLRKQLRCLDTKHGQQLFLTLYKSWSHNPVAAFSLALTAQAYELAASMLQIFADMEITVNMLIQLDQLVQLLESPAFAYLRLQLLEPDRYPYLFKCLYGIFMLLPQSSAFTTLRSRLNSASSLGFMHVMPKSATTSSASSSISTRTTPARITKSTSSSHSNNSNTKQTSETINFEELLAHFKTVQQNHQNKQQRR